MNEGIIVIILFAAAAVVAIIYTQTRKIPPKIIVKEQPPQKKPLEMFAEIGSKSFSPGSSGNNDLINVTVDIPKMNGETEKMPYAKPKPLIREKDEISAPIYDPASEVRLPTRGASVDDVISLDRVTIPTEQMKNDIVTAKSIPPQECLFQ